MPYLLSMLLLLFVMGCTRLDDVNSITITETSWVHDNLFDDSRIVSPFDFRTDRSLVLEGSRVTLKVMDSDTTTQRDSIEMIISTKNDIFVTAEDSIYGKAEVREEDFTYFALQTLILAIASKSTTPFWSTIEETTNDTIFDSCRSFLEEYGENIIVISTDPLYIEFKARFLPGLTAAVNRAIDNDNLFAEYYERTLEDESFKEAYQEATVAPRITEMMDRGIFLDEEGTVRESLTKEQKEVLRWFNTKFIFYGIVQNNYRREMMPAPQVMQYHKVEVITNRYRDSLLSSDTTTHVMGNSRNIIQWLYSQQNDTPLNHNKNGFLPASLEANITDKESCFLPLMNLPLLNWDNFVDLKPISGFSTVTIAKEQGSGVFPYTISNHFNFYDNGSVANEYTMLTGDIAVDWQVNKRSKEGNITAEDEYFGEMRTLYRVVQYSYLDRKNRARSLKEETSLTFKEWK